MSNRARLADLTARWRLRHEARRPALGARPPASPEREALAARSFPFRDVEPAEYVAAHGGDMPGFTYDDEKFADAELDAWIVEVGRLLRATR